MPIAPLLALLAVATPVPSPAPTPTPAPPLALQRIAVELVDADTVWLTLVGAKAPAALPATLVRQRLLAGTTEVPLAASEPPSAEGGLTRVRIKVSLPQIPEAFLSLDPHRVPVRWEGLAADGKPTLVMEGTPDLGDPGEVDLPVRQIYDTYCRLDDLRVTPGFTGVALHALLNLYNPFSFDVVVTRVTYRVMVEGDEIMAGERPGLRLRASQRSDVLVEQEVGFGAVTGSLGALLRGVAPTLDATIVIRTPAGEHPIPLQF
jgi:hypothetical protein